MAKKKKIKKPIEKKPSAREIELAGLKENLAILEATWNSDPRPKAKVNNKRLMQKLRARIAELE
jgi:hypothetical protein